MSLSNKEIIDFLKVAKEDLTTMLDESIKLGGENTFSAGFYSGLIEAHDEFIRLLGANYEE